MQLRLARLSTSLALGLGLTLAVLWLAGGRVAIAAGPWFVDPTGSDSNTCLAAGAANACATIQGAVDKASSGDTISVAAGTYAENVSISGKALTLVGADYATSIVDGGGAGRVFITDADLALIELTLRNGLAAGSHGGALYTTAPVTLTNVYVLSSTATYNGGGVYSTQSVAVTNGRFENNISEQGGGVYTVGPLAITGTEFISNTVTVWGGGARAEGPADLSGGWFERNKASSGAGLFATGGGSASSTTFVSNVAQNFGGGAYFTGTATLLSATFISNQGNSGGGLFTDAPATVDSVTFRGNLGLAGGGGAYFNAPVTLTNSNFYTNVASNGTNVVFGGGAIFGAAATLEGGAFISNTAYHAGGGAYFVSPATLNGTAFISNTTLTNRGGGAYFDVAASLQNVSFLNNQAPGERGAGAFFHTTAAITGSSFINNTAANRAGGALFTGAASLSQTLFINNNAGVHGGGAYFATAFNLERVYFIGNTAAGNGGAVFTAGSANSRVVNGLFSGNNAGQAGEDLLLGASGTTELIHVTLANTSTNSGAAIYATLGPVLVTNTIFANYAGSLVITTGVTASADYNLYFNAPTNAVTGSHSLTGTDPLFQDLLDLNFHLDPLSPAYRAGLNLGVATDLDGLTRGNPPTIGAYELLLDADLDLGLSGAPALTVPGAIITYSLVVTNTGPDTAILVSVTNTLPANVAFVSLQSPGGWSCTTPAVGNTGEIVCTSATLAASANATFTIVVQVTGAAAPSEVLTNSAVATTAATDSDTPNQVQATSQLYAYRQYLVFVPVSAP